MIASTEKNGSEEHIISDMYSKIVNENTNLIKHCINIKRGIIII